MGFLLDTNTVSEFIRRPHGKVGQRITRLGDAQVCTSIVVAAELRYGAIKRRSAGLATRVQTALRLLRVIPLAPPADQRYGEIRDYLERADQMISANDLLIAAQAVSLGHVVVTANVREFSRVPNLLVENWLAP